MRTTHTYAVLDVSPEAYGEIRDKLAAFGYQHAFHEDSAGPLIDMHGIAVQASTPAPADPEGAVAAARRWLFRLTLANRCQFCVANEGEAHEPSDPCGIVAALLSLIPAKTSEGK